MWNAHPRGSGHLQGTSDGWSLSFNPALDRAWHGISVPKGVTFAPNAKIGFELNKKVSAGLEYYGATGSLTGFDPLRQQEHALMPVVDLNLGPKWECNVGVGVGMTGATDHLLVKLILGRRFDFKTRQ